MIEFKDRVFDPSTGNIFVFGSNEAGIHGAGAALFARQKLGAKLHQGKGLQGQSYAIPTKDWRIEPLPLSEIAYYVDEFKSFATKNPDMTFFVTRIGCGLAGFTDIQIAPMFRNVSANVILPIGWDEVIVCSHDYSSAGRCKKCGFHR